MADYGDRIVKWLAEIDEITAAFREEFGGVGVDVLNRRPEKNRWSVAENMDHLIRVNESYFPVLERLRAGIYKPPLVGRIRKVAEFTGRAALAGSGPPESRESFRPMRTFKVWEPRRQAFFSNPLGEFVDHQGALKGQIRECEGVLDRDPVIGSPASPVLAYPLSMAFDIIIAHERRHLEQAKEALGGAAAQ